LPAEKIPILIKVNNGSLLNIDFTHLYMVHKDNRYPHADLLLGAGAGLIDFPIGKFTTWQLGESRGKCLGCNVLGA
jgi:hypothetical protein